MHACVCNYIHIILVRVGRANDLLTHDLLTIYELLPSSTVGQHGEKTVSWLRTTTTAAEIQKIPPYVAHCAQASQSCLCLCLCFCLFASAVIRRVGVKLIAACLFAVLASVVNPSEWPVIRLPLRHSTLRTSEASSVYGHLISMSAPLKWLMFRSRGQRPRRVLEKKGKRSESYTRRRDTLCEKSNTVRNCGELLYYLFDHFEIGGKNAFNIHIYVCPSGKF